MLFRKSLLIVALWAWMAVPVLAQQATAPYPDRAPMDVTVDSTAERPIPYPVMPEQAFLNAVDAGTRTETGAPGESYWTNTAAYDFDVRVDPSTNVLSGEGTIEYHNNSPDTLRQVIVHLRQNIHQEGAIRNRNAEVTGGITLESFSLEGQSLREVQTPQDLRSYGQGYATTDTRLVIFPPSPVAPGDTVTMDAAWNFQIPGEDNFRMGQDGEVYYLAYWYPHVAVYDDVHGWQAEPYQGNGEFYMGWADYTVDVTVPAGWLVGATGTLQNDGDVLTEETRQRLNRAAEGDSIVNVVTADERGDATQPPADGDSTLTWSYQADRVRDFAFGTSGAYVWDATAAETGDGSSMIHALYRPDASAWERGAEYGKFSIEHLSDMLLPYPYPQMTAVEGIIGGGMEFPMITLIGGDRTPESLFGVTYHEISHMWFPMVVGSDEKSYAWMDEGTTSFNTTEGEKDFYDKDAWAPSEQWYYRFGGTAADGPPMRHSDQYPQGSPMRVFASYAKPSVMLHALKGIIGEQVFFDAYRTFAERWTYKHPTPYDFFNTFEDVSGRELDWFWTSAFYEGWAFDHAITSVTETDDAVEVTVEDRGRIVLPVVVEATYADGETITRRVEPDAWLDGARVVTLSLQPGDVTEVVIDPGQYFPDVDRTNNDWSADDGASSSP